MGVVELERDRRPDVSTPSEVRVQTALGGGRPEEILQRDAQGGNRVGSHLPEDRGQDVDEADRLGDPAAREAPVGEGDDHGHAQELLVEGATVPEAPVVAEFLAVIRREDDQPGSIPGERFEEADL